MTTDALSGEAYPLYWPEGWPRTAQRKNAPYAVNFIKARDDLATELRLLGGTKVVISTNVPIRRDSLPLANYAEPRDPGVAVYWWEGSGDKRIERVIACDQWVRVKDNLRAAGLAIAALRALKRSGASQILDRAFVGLTALAATNPRRTWREVFGWPESRAVTRENVETEYKNLAMLRHPDRGGTHEGIVELNAAYEQALAEMRLAEMRRAHT
jgi:hypothetical protein